MRRPRFARAAGSMLLAGLMAGTASCTASSAPGAVASSDLPTTGVGAPSAAGVPTPTALPTPTTRATVSSAGAAADLLGGARTALGKRPAFRIKGPTTLRGSALVIDFTIAKETARGSVTYGERKLKVIRLGDTAYAKGDPESLVDLLAVPAARADVLGDRWLALPVASSTQPLVAALDPVRLLAGTKPTLGATGLFQGQSVRSLVPGGVAGISLVLPRRGAPTLLGVSVDPDGVAVPVLRWPSSNLGVQRPKKDRILTLS